MFPFLEVYKTPPKGYLGQPGRLQVRCNRLRRRRRNRSKLVRVPTAVAVPQGAVPVGLERERDLGQGLGGLRARLGHEEISARVLAA